MGADLICFISIGPAKISDVKKKRAAEQVEKIAAFAKQVRDLMNKNEDERSDEESEFLDNATSNELLKNYEEQEQCDQLDPGAVDYMADAKGEEEVNKFVEWWETLSGRDTAGRRLPEDPAQQVVVCGDMSWGDSPDGYGYSTMRYAYWFGIPQILGVH